MKVTDSESIRRSESELIDVLTGDLDWAVIEKVLKERFNLTLRDDVEYKKGDIVVHKDKVAYKLDFDVRVTLSLLFGRDGECIDVTTSGENEDISHGDIENGPDYMEGDGALPDRDGEGVEKEKPLRTPGEIKADATRIAEMLMEIND